MPLLPEDVLVQFAAALPYSEYLGQFERDASSIEAHRNSPASFGDGNFIDLNWSRSVRNAKQFSPIPELTEAIKKLESPLLWLVITESWCGDSAQTLPALAGIASLSPLIQFRIVLRDSTSLIESYLTNGARSIPKLIVLSAQGNELATWGPRPRVAQELFTTERNSGIPKAKAYEHLHLWYARDRMKEVQKEIADLLQTLVP